MLQTMPNSRRRIDRRLWPPILAAGALVLAALVMRVSGLAITKGDPPRVPDALRAFLAFNTTRHPLLGADNGTHARVAISQAPIADVPFWLLPMTGTYKCSNVDGYLCGLSHRFYEGLFVGNDVAMNKVIETYDSHHYKYKGPAVFRWDQPPDINTDEENNESNYFKFYPARLKSYKYGFSLYKALVYDLKDGTAAQNFGMPTGGRTPYENDLSKQPTNCHVLLYGAANANAGPGKVDFRSIPIRVTQCKGDICEFSYASSVAFFCGVYSDLGAPIICDDNKVVSYIVIEAGKSGTPSDTEENCTEYLKAVKAATIANDVWNDVKRFYDNDNWHPG